jgi:hypothetical protein
MDEPSFDLAAAHRWFSVECFNRAWAYIDKKQRTPEEDEEMILLSLASAWHWGQRADCTNINRSIAFWQNSRTYALAGQAENARRYALLCRAISQAEDVSLFYLGYAYEALARAETVAGNSTKADEFIAEARRIAENVEEKEDRDLLQADLDTL